MGQAARGWLLAAAVVLLLLQLAAAAPHQKSQETAAAAAGAAEQHEEPGFLAAAWRWVKHAARKVKGWIVGKHSLYNQLKQKLGENRTISIMGKTVSFTLPERGPTSSSSSASEGQEGGDVHDERAGGGGVHWGHSLSAVVENLKREPVLRVLLALYINIVIFLGVYGYLVARHILLSINLKKAAQPEKERERRRLKERKKEVKKMAREARGGGGGGANPTYMASPLSNDGHDTLRSTDFEEEIVMDRYPPAAAAAAPATEPSAPPSPNNTVWVTPRAKLEE